MRRMIIYNIILFPFLAKAQTPSSAKCSYYARCSANVSRLCGTNKNKATFTGGFVILPKYFINVDQYTT